MTTLETLVAAENAHGIAKAHHDALAADADRWIAYYDDLPRDLAADLAVAEVELSKAWAELLVADEVSWEEYAAYAHEKWLYRNGYLD